MGLQRQNQQSETASGFGRGAVPLPCAAWGAGTGKGRRRFHQTNPVLMLVGEEGCKHSTSLLGSASLALLDCNPCTVITLWSISASYLFFFFFLFSFFSFFQAIAWRADTSYILLNSRHSESSTPPLGTGRSQPMFWHLRRVSSDQLDCWKEWNGATLHVSFPSCVKGVDDIRRERWGLLVLFLPLAFPCCLPLSFHVQKLLYTAGHAGRVRVLLLWATKFC